MSKRFYTPSHTLVRWVLTLVTVLFMSSVSFSAVAYTIPQTAEVTLAWDANDPAPDGYRIYQRTEGQSYDYNQPVWTGSNTSGTVYNLNWDTTYLYVVRAYLGELESSDSEEVSFHSPLQETQTHTITTTAGDHGTISPSGSLDFDEGSDQTFTIIPDSGCHITDVLVDGISQGVIDSYTFSQIATDHTIEAVFSVNTYIISAAAGDHGNISPVGDTGVAHGQSQTFTISPDDGCHIANVIVDGAAKGVITFHTFENVTENHTITVNFAVNTYQISATAGAGGSISPSGSTDVSHGGSQTYTITPDSGYHVAQLLVDGQAVGTPATYVFPNVVTDHRILVNFEPNTFVISATAGAGGSISPSGQIVASQGSSQMFAVTADEGYEVQDLLVNGLSQGSLNSYTLQNLNADCTIEARFNSVNQAPAADAGPDQKVDEGQVVNLSGLNSVDLDDGIAAFHWYQVQGEDVLLRSPDQAETSFTAPNVDALGRSLVFALEVTDFSGETTVDTCIVNVTWVNMPPTADAGGVQTVSQGATVSLDAAGSTDPDDGIAEYHWQQIQGPEVVLSGNQSAVATFNATDIGPEGASLAFQVTVTDAGGLQDTDTCLVTVVWINTPPEADAGTDQQVNTGDEVTLDGSQSTDTDGDTFLSYRWRQTDGTPVELSDATAEKPSFMAPGVEGETQTLTFELTVTDNGGMLDMDTCQVVVTASVAGEGDTTPPRLTVESPASSPVTVSWFSINISGSAWDDTGVEKVTWENDRGGSGVAVGTTRWQVSNIRLRYGTNVITLTAADAGGNTTSVTKTVVVRFRWWR